MLVADVLFAIAKVAVPPQLSTIGTGDEVVVDVVLVVDVEVLVGATVVVVVVGAPVVVLVDVVVLVGATVVEVVVEVVGYTTIAVPPL